MIFVYEGPNNLRTNRKIKERKLLMRQYAVLIAVMLLSALMTAAYILWRASDLDTGFNSVPIFIAPAVLCLVLWLTGKVANKKKRFIDEIDNYLCDECSKYQTNN